MGAGSDLMDSWACYLPTYLPKVPYWVGGWVLWHAGMKIKKGEGRREGGANITNYSISKVNRVHFLPS